MVLTVKPVDAHHDRLTWSSAAGSPGSTFALEAAAEHGDVVVVTKRSADEANTKYAQGGIAAVLGAGRLLRGAHRGHARAPARASATSVVVEICVTRGPARIASCASVGARFDKAEDAEDDRISTCTSRAATRPAGSSTPPT